MSELHSDSHSIGEANYHLQFTPAYRQDIFADEAEKVLTRDYLLAAAKRYVEESQKKHWNKEGVKQRKLIEFYNGS